MRNHRNGGFTLVELMIVTAIVGILAAISHSNYERYAIKRDIMAKATEIRDRLDSASGSYVAGIHNLEDTHLCDDITRMWRDEDSFFRCRVSSLRPPAGDVRVIKILYYQNVGSSNRLDGGAIVPIARAKCVDGQGCTLMFPRTRRLVDAFPDDKGRWDF